MWEMQQMVCRRDEEQQADVVLGAMPRSGVESNATPGVETPGL
jgi:hypothetical protein